MKKHFLVIAIVALLIAVSYVGCSTTDKSFFAPTSGCFNSVYKDRLCFIGQADIHDLAKENFKNGYIIADLPENYADLVSVTYCLKDTTKKENSLKNYVISDDFIVFEFKIQEESVLCFFMTKNLRESDADVSVLKETAGKTEDKKVFKTDRNFKLFELPVKKYEQITDEERTFAPFGNITINSSGKKYTQRDFLRIIDGYEPTGMIQKIYNEELVIKSSELFRYGVDDGENSYVGACFNFYDNRSVSAEEKQAWQMQVIKDILANMKCYYWAAPEA